MRHISLEIASYHDVTEMVDRITERNKKKGSYVADVSGRTRPPPSLFFREIIDLLKHNPVIEL